MSDILDDIDALIDEQLEAGEGGAIRRAASVERRCPHCFRAWHGLAITQRLERMRIEYQDRALNARLRGEESEYAESAILDGYRYDEDDSRVICPGSDFIGPIQAPPRCGCAQCLAWRAVIGDDETPGDVARGMNLGFQMLPRANDAISGLIARAVELGFYSVPADPVAPGAWRDIVPNRSTERRHSEPETSPESDSDDPPTSLADLQRRARERGSRPQEHPVWAARMDRRRGRR